MLGPLHRAWRLIPARLRRSALSAASAAVAPRPDREPQPARHGVIIGGEMGRASGLGEGARLMASALRQHGVRVWTIEAGLTAPARELGPDARATEALPAGAPLILHVNAPLLPAALLRLPRRLLRGRRVVGYWAWELETTPADWRHGSRFVHEVWAPSRFTAAALDSLAPGRVRVIPHPVASSPPRPSSLTRGDFSLPDEAFIVLVSFSLASSFERKNPLAAVAAFRAAFGDRADRLLVIKIVHADHAPADLARLRAAIAGAPNIRLETRLLPAPDSHALTRCADAVLSLHRSEGFGLVPAEAMVLGRPVVATDYSGTTDFLDEHCAMPVPYRLVPARDPRGVFEAPGARWADADIGVASAMLQQLAASPELGLHLGRAGQAAAGARLGAGPLCAAVAGWGLPVQPA